MKSIFDFIYEVKNKKEDKKDLKKDKKDSKKDLKKDKKDPKKDNKKEDKVKKETKKSKKEDKKKSSKPTSKKTSKKTTKKSTKKDIYDMAVSDFWYVPSDILPYSYTRNICQSQDKQSDYQLIISICKKLGKEKSTDFFNKIRELTSEYVAIKDIPAEDQYKTEMILSLKRDFKDFKLKEEDLVRLFQIISNNAELRDEKNTLESKLSLRNILLEGLIDNHAKGNKKIEQPQKESIELLRDELCGTMKRGFMWFCPDEKRDIVISQADSAKDLEDNFGIEKEDAEKIWNLPLLKPVNDKDIFDSHLANYGINIRLW